MGASVHLAFHYDGTVADFMREMGDACKGSVPLCETFLELVNGDLKSVFCLASALDGEADPATGASKVRVCLDLTEAGRDLLATLRAGDIDGLIFKIEHLNASALALKEPQAHPIDNSGS